MENINNVKEGKKPIRGSKEKSFQGNQKKNRDNNSSSSNRFHPQNKFRKNNGENKSPKENHIAFDNFLEQKIGAETLQKLANLRGKKEAIELPKEEVSNPTIFEKPKEIPSRGFALAKYKESLTKQNKTIIANQEAKIDQEISHLKTPGGLLLDEWQYNALQALLAGKHVIVDAPTSAGKTRVIEALLEYRMKEGGKLIYTSPVKSLSNDKYREFSEKYGREAVGINTGDFKENLNAPIMLATLETYRNSLLGIEPNMSRRVVVYDEYHFLQDESRGSAWEESLILTPKDSQLVLLSASVPNSEEFASWIKSLTGKETVVVKVTKRPVPLVHMVYTKFGWIFAEDLKLKPDEEVQLAKIGRIQRKENRRFRGKDVYNSFIQPISTALELNMGPIVM